MPYICGALAIVVVPMYGSDDEENEGHLGRYWNTEIPIRDLEHGRVIKHINDDNSRGHDLFDEWKDVTGGITTALNDLIPLFREKVDLIKGTGR